jgi:hypothetical protein
VRLNGVNPVALVPEHWLPGAAFSRGGNYGDRMKMKKIGRTREDRGRTRRLDFSTA